MSSEPAPILRAVDAAFVRRGEVLVAPFSLLLLPGGYAALDAAEGRTAMLRARMLAGIVKPTSGTLSIGDFDPRIQPVQAKRSIGFVSVSMLAGNTASLERSAIDAHADLWGVDRARARLAAADILERFAEAGPHALALALALIRPVGVLVLDRPPLEFEAALAERLALRCAVVASRFVPPASGARPLTARLA